MSRTTLARSNRPALIASGRALATAAARAMGLAGALAAGRWAATQARAILARLVLGGRARVATVADSLARGSRSVAGWAGATAGVLVPTYYAGALIALLGDDPTPDDLDDLDGLAAGQLGFLAGFRADLEAGRVPTRSDDPDGGPRTAPGFVARAMLYASAAWSVAEGVKRGHLARAGWRWERRALGPARHSCGPCVAESGRGWAPIGSLKSIGDSPCQSRCNCHFIYSKSRRPR